VTSPPFTYFAPAETATPEALRRQHTVVVAASQLREAFDAIPDGVLVLNRQRQIVFANRAFCSFVGVSDPLVLLGLRPGEAVGCIRVAGTACPCGTTEHCRACGAVDAILASHGGQPQTRECRIQRGAAAGPLDLRVRAAPFALEGERFTLFILQDIAHEKRRAALERIFFHDVLNTAGNIKSLIDLVSTAGPEEAPRYQELLEQLSAELVGQIQAQRELLAAEAGELVVNPEEVDPAELLRNAAALYGGATPVQTEVPPKPPTMLTDRVLLQRVLANMIKNAAEAAGTAETIRAGLTVEGERITFWVRNRAVLAPMVKLQIFQRSFSTKGPGRGLGTYSMQLLSERYLRGSVDFTSSELEGTTFRATYPLVLPDPAA
jgi:signal transduction histidine kinase